MAFSDWYADNKIALNKRRRKRYKKDAAYRERQLSNTRHWRKQRAKAKALEPEKPKTIFTIGEVAEVVKCEQKTIRTLEKAGLIPASSDGVHHRRFNKRQIKLIAGIVHFRQRVHYKNPKYRPTLKTLSEKAHSQWQ